MSGSVFLDTDGWLSLLNASEYQHQNTIDLWLEIGRRKSRIVLTDWIIAETGNGLARSREKANFADAVERFWQSPVVEIMVVDQTLIGQALERYKQYVDKTWGLVDCASFIVMQERGITEAFTSDHDFEQAGFRCLLRV